MNRQEAFNNLVDLCHEVVPENPNGMAAAIKAYVDAAVDGRGGDVIDGDQFEIECPPREFTMTVENFRMVTGEAPDDDSVETYHVRINQGGRREIVEVRIASIYSGKITLEEVQEGRW